MSDVVTLTLNPAIDLSTSVDRVEPVRKLRCGPGRRDPGGGGVNVARAASRLGCDVTAVYPIGGEVGAMLRRLLDGEGIASLTVPIEGETREDVTVLDQASGEQYRFVLPGPPLLASEWAACLRALRSLGPGPAYVCASGSLPPGAPDDAYAQVAALAAEWGARFLLDTSGAALKAALGAPAYLIKPNLRELRELTGAALEDQAAMIRACRGLIARGHVEVVALSLGADGALLVSGDQAWRAPALAIRPASTVGAGDSFLGAMVWALAAGRPLDEAFRWAVAGGSAALLAPGTELCLAADVARLVSQVMVEAVGG
jgi:6-phosphofructokinase 2